MHIITSFYTVPYNFVIRKREEVNKFPKLSYVLRILRLSLLPLCITFVFYLLYVSANPIFSNFAKDFWNTIGEFFKQISIGRILFISFGIIILSVIYFRNEVKIFLEKDLSFSEKLERIRNIRRKKHPVFSSITKGPYYTYSKPPFKSIALKNQNRRGVILLLMVNILLLTVNFIDIKWLWFGFEIPEGFSLKDYVRKGTGLLIVSILVSIGVLLYYFRRNQNFYQRNSLLKWLAYFWIAQNIFLCMSVFLRNYYYIEFHGLAYKRIGVHVFLALTAVGLLTLYNKIRNIRSAYYLLRVNTWAVYIVLVLLSCYNWDVKIAQYNLAHWNKGEVDIDFYLSLSDKALPVIMENLDKVKEQIDAHRYNKVKWVRNLDYDKFVQKLSRKKDRFIERQDSYSWLSYNIPDNIAYKELSKREYSIRE
jgi:hypothetical protein